MISLQTEVSTPGGAAEREVNQVQVLTFTATRTLIHKKRNFLSSVHVISFLLLFAGAIQGIKVMQSKWNDVFCPVIVEFVNLLL